MTGFQIISCNAKTANRGLFSSDMQTLVVARVEFPDNAGTLFLSRWEDEENWVADAHIQKNGMVSFSNGEGSRVTNARILDPESECARQLHKLSEFVLTKFVK